MSAESNRSVGDVRCDECSEPAPVARYLDYNDAMTHRNVRWLCADCHPRG